MSKRIKDVLGDHKNMQKFFHNSIGVDRTPQTPASPFPKGSQHLFPVPIKTDKKNDGGRTSKERSSSKEHKSRRSRSTEKHERHLHHRSQSHDTVLKMHKKSPENVLSQNGYATAGSLENGIRVCEPESKRKENDRNEKSRNLSSSHRERKVSSDSNSRHSSKPRHDSQETASNKHLEKEDSVANSSHKSRKSAIKPLPPLTMPGKVC